MKTGDLFAPRLVSVPAPADTDTVEDYDDYDDAVVVVPVLRIVPREPTGVHVKLTGRGYEITHVSRDGHHWSATVWTKDELIQLMSNIADILEG